MLRQFLLLAFVVLTFLAPATAERPSLLKMFSRKSVEADPAKSYELTLEDGPWMILAAHFVGEGCKSRAERLALEIRSELGLPAFIHREQFDFTGTPDRNQLRLKRTRYANEYEYDAYAVLCGEYDSVNHPQLKADLKRIKTANPSVFRNKNDVEAETRGNNPVTALQQMSQKLTQFRQLRDPVAGPMRNAFVTRNPMLPEEFFEAPEVDSFVRKLNDDKPYSLLEADGKYTVVVRTFEGLGTFANTRKSADFTPNLRRLDRFAADANRMVTALRKKGIEAYQYHDRRRSLVTVGTFDSLGRELPDKSFEYDTAIRRVMREYSASNVPTEIANQIAGRAQGMPAKSIVNIPFDLQPTPISIPRVSKRSLFMGALGMNR